MTNDQLKKDALQFLEETFDTHHGIYIDKGTSFFATLENASAAEASQRATDTRPMTWARSARRSR